MANDPICKICGGERVKNKKGGYYCPPCMKARMAAGRAKMLANRGFKESAAAVGYEDAPVIADSLTGAERAELEALRDAERTRAASSGAGWFDIPYTYLLAQKAPTAGADPLSHAVKIGSGGSGTKMVVGRWIDVPTDPVQLRKNGPWTTYVDAMLPGTGFKQSDGSVRQPEIIQLRLGNHHNGNGRDPNAFWEGRPTADELRARSKGFRRARISGHPEGLEHFCLCWNCFTPVARLGEFCAKTYEYIWDDRVILLTHEQIAYPFGRKEQKVIATVTL